MKTSLPSKFSFCAVLFAASLFSGQVSAQTPALEFTSGAGNPTGSGPTLANQAITFQNNTDNPTGNTFSSYAPPLTATFSLSNQQYTLPTSQISTARGLSFGASLSTSSNAISSSLFADMNLISSPSNSRFTSSTAILPGTGIDINANKAVEIFTSTKALYNVSVSTSGRYYYGDLTITFNRAVTNPVLHLVGLGGYSDALGFATELELQTTGIVLSKLSGSTELTISSGRNILNSSSNPGSVTGSGAASGSVLASGLAITSLTFRIYMRGDGDETTWDPNGGHPGDVWLIGVSTNTPENVLPVKLIDFNAMLNKSTVDVKWLTAGEKGVSHFEIERSFDGSNYSQAELVFAHGKTDETSAYSFSDDISNIKTGIIYYRLKMVDIDKKTSYSRVRIIRLSGQNAELTISTYPNPAINEIRVTLPSAWQNKKVTFELYKANGATARQTIAANASQTETININSLAPGFYIIKLTCDGQIVQQKIIKN